jgi:methionyl-tRNA formyltransferase
LNIIFAGTPDFAAVVLADLIKSDHHLTAVYTQPDRPSGRGRKLTASAVKNIAIENNIEVFQPLNFKEPSDVDIIEQLNADIMIVVAYGLILPEVVLNAPKKGCLNIHASILPKWRGAAPIQRSILNGDRETGVTIMQMDKGLDTGDMLTISRCPIEEGDTASSLHDKLAILGSQALLETLDNLDVRQSSATAQDNSLSTYAEKIKKQEGLINWQDNAKDIVLKIQAFNSWPVAYCLYKDKNLRLWKAKVAKDIVSNKKPGIVIDESKEGLIITCASGCIQVTEIQLPGKKRTQVKDFINSNSLKGEDLSL